tara:strand:- start:122 stop:292 length:171 start_codon:yes stop_codon:yes gene_type:complete
MLKLKRFGTVFDLSIASGLRPGFRTRHETAAESRERALMTFTFRLPTRRQELEPIA